MPNADRTPPRRAIHIDARHVDNVALATGQTPGGTPVPSQPASTDTPLTPVPPIGPPVPPVGPSVNTGGSLASSPFIGWSLASMATGVVIIAVVVTGVSRRKSQRR